MTTRKTPAATAKKTTTAKKAPTKKTAAKKTAVTKTTSAEVVPIKKDEETQALEPVDEPQGTAVASTIVEAEIVEQENPIANAIEILSATGLNTPRDAVDYSVSYVQSHPDAIDDLVDRKTERVALLGYQAYMRGGERALERFLYDHWGVPQPRTPVGAHAASPPPPATQALLGVVPPQEPARETTTEFPSGPHDWKDKATDRPERWVPKVPPLPGAQGSVEPPPGGGLQTYDQAFEAAKKDGDFQ